MRTFRNYLILSCAAASLAACGGDTQPQTVGSIAAPSTPGGGGSGVTPAPSPTPTPSSGGAGGGVTPAPTPTPTPPPTFLDVSAQTSFNAVGGFHSLSQDVNTGASLYQGDANTVKTPGGTVTFNPRDGVFTLAIADTNAGITRNYRFQDPAHRTDPPAADVPTFQNFNYLEVLDDATTTPFTMATFFYQRPGTSTTYVTLAGFVRTSLTAANEFQAERGAFVFGQLTPTAQVPISGSGAYKGGFIATMVNSGNGAGGANNTSLQWLSGNSAVDVNFATGAVNLAFTGNATSGYVRGTPTNALQFPSGTAFFANGTATVDLVRNQGFVGQFQNVCFVAACGSAGSVAVDFSRFGTAGQAGASSIDGAFYGPNGVNVGGSFRVVGGVPNQRIDILGAFTGAKP